MSTKFKKTRRSRKSISHSGGAVLQYGSLEIVDINEKIRSDNIFGVATIQYNMRTKGLSGYQGRMDVKTFQEKGTLFNNSVCHYSYKGKNFLLGVARTVVGNNEDVRTNTTIHNRDPFSNNSPWFAGWSHLHPDYPLFFVLDLADDARRMNFFHMQANINYMSGKDSFTGQIEDPRIMIHPNPDANVVLFYGHHNTQVANPTQPEKGVDSAIQPSELYKSMGENLSADLNAGKKKPVPATLKELDPLNPQYLYVSWCKKDDIDAILEEHYFSMKGGETKRSIPNSTWKLLCSNLLNITPEKNWAIIPNTVGVAPVFDFVRSIGEFSKAFVVYRYPVSRLTSPSTVDGEFNSISTKCDYIQSIDGKMKPAGKNIRSEGYFSLPHNDKITIISQKTKFWFNALLRLFVSYIPDDEVYYPAAKFRSKKYNQEGVNVVEFKYPFKQGNGTYNARVIIKLDDLTNHKVKFLKGISSGGPTCPILGGAPNEVLAIGHFKCHHAFVYPAMVAALEYKADSRFRRYVSENIQSEGGKFVPMGDIEKEAFLNFVQYLTDEVNIFRYTYSVINSQEPYNPRVKLDGIEEGGYKNQQILHHDQMYSTYIFKMKNDTFELLSISPQFFFDNSPKDCKTPVLQFSSTIASNGADTYYIPYGDNDCRGRILLIGKDDLHTFLKMEKLVNEDKGPDDHNFYLDVIKSFFKVHMLKPPVK
jgi:hypothetical protein